MDKNNKNINECDVPTNCITPANVGGMGAIEFPGDNPNNGYDGVRGSGDLPLPSGKVYNQILPFDSFVKSSEWKRKKKNKNKKPNTPDSSYYKKLKSSEYYKNFVYDFKEYMDKAKEGL